MLQTFIWLGIFGLGLIFHVIEIIDLADEWEAPK